MLEKLNYQQVSKAENKNSSSLRDGNILQFCSSLISFLPTKKGEKKFYLCFNIHLLPISDLHLLIIIGINFTYK